MTVLSEEGKFAQTCAQEWRHREKIAPRPEGCYGLLQHQREEKRKFPLEPGDSMTPPTPWFQLCSPQNCATIHFYILSHPVCGTSNGSFRKQATLYWKHLRPNVFQNSDFFLILDGPNYSNYCITFPVGAWGQDPQPTCTNTYLNCFR